MIIYENYEGSTGALASKTASAIDSGPKSTVTEDFRLLKTEGCIAAPTLVDGDMLIYGIADGELTSAEIMEALVVVPEDRNDNLGNERAQRPVFPVGELLGTTHRVDHFSISQRWTFGNSESWQWWVYNPAVNALTDSELILFAKTYGVWVT